MKSRLCYVVTDIEADGPSPRFHSMLSLASVAVGEDGEFRGEMTINLKPLAEATQDPGTMLWWRSQPVAWAAATRNPQDPEAAMRGWFDWVSGISDHPVFVSSPLVFDGTWVDWYLCRFLNQSLFPKPREACAFVGAGVDLPTLVMALLGQDLSECKYERYPEHWLGGHRHSHCALDDARGYAHLLSFALQRRRTLLSEFCSNEEY